MLSNLYGAWIQTVQTALTTCNSGLSSVTHQNPHIKVIVAYLFILELFVDKICFFKFLFMSEKPLDQNHCYSYIVQTSLNCSIRTRKGKYPVLKINAKFCQLIKHTKISYSIASLVFYKFLCVAYQNGLDWSTSRLK